MYERAESSERESSGEVLAQKTSWRQRRAKMLEHKAGLHTRVLHPDFGEAYLHL